jgi:hypothetical protein
MKSLISNALKTVAALSLFCLNTSSTAVFGAVDHTYIQFESVAHNSPTYTWTNRGHASSYVVVLTPRTNGSPIIIATKNNSISLSGIANGVYRVTVYGVFSNKNTFAIVKDTILIGSNKKSEYPTTPPTQSSEDI